WIPPAGAVAPTPTPAPPPPELAPEKLRGRTVSLSEAIDVALRNSPLTRQSWLLARSAAAGLGSKRSALFPSVEVDAQAVRQKQTSSGGRLSTLLTTYGPTASLSFLVLDLGGRSADIAEAEQSLYAADFTHNAVMNDLILLVAQSYYSYQGVRALLVAQEASLKQAEENYAAATERHRAGVATIADVLQARTSLSQQRLAYETVKGQIETLRGQLTTALGVPIDLPVDAAPLPEEQNVDEVVRSVDVLIADAGRLRPDLAAARSRALAAQRHVRSVRSSGLPTLSLGASINRTWFEGPDALLTYGDNYSLGLFFRWPVFTGFKTAYDTRQAQALAEAAGAQAETAAQQVIYQVWSSYYNLQTAVQQVRASRDLLESSKESAEVARGRYKEGVGSILDLLTAESALATALAQDVRSRAGFLLAVAQLAHDTGTVDLGPAPEKKGTP
ncbi:MAG TPA: TolC family protein, partial [Thermoanaerobaculia bacterium]|nr:TolC family protein [Thermoanaerobaculia bacterium]